MSKVLITFGTRPLAQRIGNMLSTDYEVCYGSSEPFPDVLKNKNYRALANAANPAFVHELLKLCLDEAIDMVLPLGQAELQPLIESRVLLAEYGVELLVPQDLESCFVIENPNKDFKLQVFKEGRDIMSGELLGNEGFSGAGLLSDSGEECMLCLV